MSILSKISLKTMLRLVHRFYFPESDFNEKVFCTIQCPENMIARCFSKVFDPNFKVEKKKRERLKHFALYFLGCELAINTLLVYASTG